MKIQKKITLVSAGVSKKKYSQFSRFMPMTAVGLHYIKANLEEHGYDVTLINQSNDDLSEQEIISRITTSEPDYLLFNQFFSTRNTIRNILSKVDKKSIVGVGGHDATFNALALSSSPEQLSDNYSGFDFVWAGEAENGLAEFLESVKKSEKPQIMNNLENRIQNLDDLSILKHNDYSGDVGFLVTSRGCFKKSACCDYCTTGQFYPDGRRSRSMGHVEKELENLILAGKKYLFIVDDNFLGFNEADLKRGDRIIEKCKSLDFKLTIMTTKEQILRAEEMGLLNKWKGTVYRAFIGIENGDESAIKKLGKATNSRFHASRSSRAIEALYRNGIALFAGYINFNPESTFEELENSARFAYENGMEAANFTNLRQGLRFYEGTKIFERYKNYIEDLQITNGEFRYSFADSSVGKFYQYLSNLKTSAGNKLQIIDELDNLNYESTDLVYMNQLQDSAIGKRYLDIRCRLNKHNYDFFMNALNGFRLGTIDLDILKSNFIKNSEKLFREYGAILEDIKKAAKYV